MFEISKCMFMNPRGCSGVSKMMLIILELNKISRVLMKFKKQFNTFQNKMNAQNKF